MLFTGRQDPPVGGVLGFRAPTLEAAEALIATDPFATGGVARYTIVAVTPTRAPWRCPAFDDFMSASIGSGQAIPGTKPS